MLSHGVRAPIPVLTSLVTIRSFGSRRCCRAMGTARSLPPTNGFGQPRGQFVHRSSTLQCRASSNSVMGNSNLFLIIYSKPGCHLCDGLKDKVQAALDKAMFQPSPLSNASLQIRNILDEPEWESAYGLAIPVMTAIKSGESDEIKIPRAPPRLSADRLADHIAKSLNL